MIFFFSTLVSQMSYVSLPTSWNGKINIRLSFQNSHTHSLHTLPAAGPVRTVCTCSYPCPSRSTDPSRSGNSYRTAGYTSPDRSAWSGSRSRRTAIYASGLAPSPGSLRFGQSRKCPTASTWIHRCADIARSCRYGQHWCQCRTPCTLGWEFQS